MQLGLAKDNQVDKSIQFWRKVKKNKKKERYNPFLYIGKYINSSKQQEKLNIGLNKVGVLPLGIAAWM